MRATEEERFWSHVVKGPEPDDCWFWSGAIGDDGYGRFWTQSANAGQRAVRPQRYAYELLTGARLLPTVQLLHRCDVPLCVHADVDPLRSHVTPGTHRDNMLDRAYKGRGVNRWTALFPRGASREEQVRRSRALRAAIRADGWDVDAITRAVNGIGPDQPTLW
ncbi:hypothetical protein [Curtobacterium sp. MCBD17_026]|uniref:hypothetical protein n=1 Tax=Curtobacterium sp. MCBD17_026 TaxID=2175621 RepID=UPI000DA8045B|nr:hypothetical protein [Curtobacterium sp. MCBD17_026]WIB72535.1 hypothetical protein DEI85_17250 [Curtobacterium sp. MCBD17_026]